ncbi:MAG: DUF4145 domain-containing protein [Pyrinomonadaceae bacterium]
MSSKCRQPELASPSIFRLKDGAQTILRIRTFRAYRTSQAFAQRTPQDRLRKLYSVTAACINTEETLKRARPELFLKMMEEQQFQLILERLDHISDEFQELREGVKKAIRIADEDPEMALARSRKVLEYVIRDVYKRHFGKEPGTQPLENLIQRLVREGYFPPVQDAYASTIRKLGNVGTHSYGEKVTAKHVQLSLTQLMQILEWYFENERPEGIQATSATEKERQRLADEEAKRQAEILQKQKEAEAQRKAAEESARLKAEADLHKRKDDEQTQDKLETPVTVESDERVPRAIGVLCGIAGVVLMIWLFSSVEQPKSLTLWEYMKNKQNDSPIVSVAAVIFTGLMFYGVGSVLGAWIQGTLKKNHKK